MPQQRSLIAPAAALLVAVGLLTTWCPGQAAGTHQLNVGVVNVTRVFKSMQETKKVEADVHARQGAVQQQGQQREVEIEDLIKHRDNNIKPGTQQYRDETAKIMQKRAELEVWSKMSNLETEQFLKESLKAAYDHVAQATAQVAETQHLDLVIADQSMEIGPDLDKTPLDRLSMALQSRAVLYANKKADITEEVLAQAEANFAKSGGSIAAPPLPTGTGAPVK